MVQLSKHDLPVIEQALKEAMSASVDYQSILAYQEVLNKMNGQHYSQGLQVDLQPSANIGINEKAEYEI
jgi:hypothetical protein